MIHTDRVFLANLSWSPSYRPSHHGTHDHLESLIARHGHPTRVSLSSLEELTATSSIYNPPSPPLVPRSPASDASDLSDTLTLPRSASRPIPIPRRSSIAHEYDVPVTPLTGRFDKGYYFAHRKELSPTSQDLHQPRPRNSRRTRPSRHSPPPRMRSDSTTFYAPVMSPTARPDSPQPSRSRAQNTSKSVPAFHLGTLPRFHPAVYQPSSSSQTLSPQSPAPHQPRQHLYRATPGPRDSVWQYRELMEGVVLPKVPSRPLSPSPSAPRLDPLRSPGPVTPLALEDAGGYLVSGTTQHSEYSTRDHAHSGPSPDVVERLIARENERIRQKAKKAVRHR
ncbi:hypothetical protein FE257_005670 [Aspergillus nanangensis]|uniref:Uncharacterized protein n=1 Tax=Aspergillus nanangensis TaxID=2582783 RepID=A0AAD4CA54_ASPNN|nr:hypothetical protein FE257_005670 [Aspergillus nanangensis]